MKPAGGNARGVARRWTGLWADAAARGSEDYLPVPKGNPSRAPAVVDRRPRRMQGRAESPCHARRHAPSCQAKKAKKKKGHPKVSKGRAESPCHARRHAPLPSKESQKEKRTPEGFQRASGKPFGTPAGVTPAKQKRPLPKREEAQKGCRGERKAPAMPVDMPL